MLNAKRACLIGVAASVLAASALSAACGESGQAARQAQILTAVRVEERMANGSWAAVPNALVQYKVFISRATDTVHIPLFTEFEDRTDADGFSVVFTDSAGKTPADIGLVFVDVTHPDGRTLFRRASVDLAFDFGAWFAEFWPERKITKELAARLCAKNQADPNCEGALTKAKLITWGRGILARLQPAG